MKRTGEAGMGAADTSAAADAIDNTLPGIPHKEYFRIGEAAQIVGVKPYVLRYWESEFKRDIRPERSRSNQRMYRRKDVETFLEIKRLRYEEKLELSGARRRLRRPEPALPDLPDLADVRDPAVADPSRSAALRSGIGHDTAAVLRDRLAAILRIVDEDEKAE